MRRYDVPEQHVLLDPELGEHSVDDRRACLTGTGPGELSFRRERDPGDAGAAVAGRLADEEERCAFAGVEVVDQPVAAGPRSVAFPIEVECVADGRIDEPGDELFHPRPNFDGRGPATAGDRAPRGRVPRRCPQL